MMPGNGLLLTGIILYLIKTTLQQAAEYGLYPVVFNLATKARISANATCGGERRETYCRLVEHVARQYARGGTHCSVCDMISEDPDERYPITNAIDGSTSWWQSPTIANGYNYHYVTIKIDLQQVYQIAYIIVKAANSPRPGNWILERSVDGTHFKPWMYFAQSDSECWNRYNMAPTLGIPRYRRDDDVICTSYFSRLDPLYGGEIHISLVNGRPGVSGPSRELIDFTMARYIRMRLQRIRTLNADLMTFMSNNIDTIDHSVTNRYFYSIKDISIGGQCICYGHARLCPRDPRTGETRCQCEGNTCGLSCERCCPLYNQQMWRPGTYSQAAYCEGCECYGHADSCVYNSTVAQMMTSINRDGVYSGGGVCVDCMHNTMGINCEICADGFYRPPGADPRSEDGCQMCLCDSPGAIGVCVKDGSRSHENVFAGDCLCKEGYCGPRCEQCAPGYHGYPDCKLCDCSRAGSANMDTCEDQCMCKDHVVGESCDRCAAGFYNLQAENREGCDACFCFSVVDTCKSSTWRRRQITSLGGWNITDVVGSGVVSPKRAPSGARYVNTTDLVDKLNSATYWQASRRFTGDRVKSYGGVLMYTFSYAINDSNTVEIPCMAFFDEDAHNYLYHADVIIEGSGIWLGHSGVFFDECTQHSVEINMTELGWQHLNGSLGQAGSPVSREEFMLVLGNIERLLIRASYHIYQTSITLFRVSLDTASRAGSGRVMPEVEVCDCPPGYTGSSCQSCADGYRRVGGILLSGICEQCQCYNHSNNCDDYTAECYNCQHHTRGPFCEDCEFGYFGNAMLGRADACKPCGCPLPSAQNFFAAGCITTADEEEQYMCIGCDQGYEGRFCEICSPGYYGDPTVPGGSCQPCNCHGNTEPNEADFCNRVTGECLSCTGYTEGFNCEQCMLGFYGSAQNGDCTKCSCDTMGSLSQNCDKETGQCECKSRYASRDCSVCEPGYGYFSRGCLPCDCDPVGSLSNTCDLITGQCMCKRGVGGTHCTRCLRNYWRFSNSGCEECACDPVGSESSSCDQLTGQCSCKPNVSGFQCQECVAGYWGFDSGDGCAACNCDPIGSEALQCDLNTGECQCRPGIEGPKCARCLVGYYGFSQYGCKRCGRCPLPGQVCDEEDGDCVCPPNTEGDQCERCAINHWGYDPYRGCKPCDCNPLGSSSLQCDLETGQCRCYQRFRGQVCEDCHPSFYDFPVCAPCQCDEAGTLAETCDPISGRCQCDSNGNCQCKENVEGSKCDRCVEGSFSLQGVNTAGCTSCFCSGHTSSCKQASYKWSTISMPDQSAVVSMSLRSTVVPSSRGYLVLSPWARSIEVQPVHTSLPVYWRLPPEMHGDQTLSYNGHLRFKVAVDVTGSGPVNSAYPLIHIVGNYRLNLFYRLEPQMTGSAIMQEYDVLLREDLWRDDAGQPVDRVTMMVALHKVQHFLIRVTHSAASVRSVRLLDLSYNVAVPAERGVTPDAYGIEECHCPDQYVGLSCQDPASGYYREHPDNYLEQDDPMSLIGESVSCQCHNHADTCDRETGVCLDCLHNTKGDHCEMCIDGYYGDATMGTVADCLMCACPLTNPSNNFSPTCALLSDGDFFCTACDEGYIGRKCERCDSGYYGNPTEIGSSCQKCHCNPEGSVNDECDSVTGQCDCYAGIIGLTCDRCAPRHAIVDGHCESCIEGCPGILFSDIDMIEMKLAGFNASAEALLPWARITALESLIEDLSNHLGGTNVSAYSFLAQQSQSVKSGLRNLQQRLAMTNTDIARLDVEDVLDHSRTLSSEIIITVDSVRGYVMDVERSVSDRIRNNSGNIHNLEAALEEAEAILLNARRTDFYYAQQLANTEARDAEDLLERAKHLRTRHNISLEREQRSADEIIKRLEEHYDTLNHTLSTISHVKAMNMYTQEVLEEMKQMIDLINRRVQFTRECIENETASTELASHLLWNESSNNYKAAMQSSVDLRGMLLHLEEHVGLLEQNMPVSRELLNRALAQAKSLDEIASGLAEQFEETKLAADAPLRAVGVYARMREAIIEAEWAASGAQDAADNASLAISSSHEGPLQEQAQQALNINHDSSVESLRIDTSSQRLSGKFADLARQQNREGAAISGSQDSVQYVTRVLDRLNSGAGPQVHQAINRTAGIKESIKEMIDKEVIPSVQIIKQQIPKQTEPKLEQLQSLSVANINTAQQAVTEVREKFDDLANLTEAVEKKKMDVERTGAVLSQSIVELREKIKVARAQANSIKVSLAHSGSCIRKYTPNFKSSASNSIKFYFKTNNTVDNMALFLLNNPQANVTDFLGVEIVEGFVRLSFDVGGGTASVEHDLEIMPTRGSEQKWYMVSVDRIANIAKLRVKEVSSDGVAVEVNATAPSTHSQLYVDDKTDLFLAGVSPDYKLPGDLLAHGFSGCLGHVTIDGQPIGLYDFKELTGSGCMGCKAVPMDQRVNGIAQLDGTGFVEMPQIRYRRERYAVQLDFKGFWENALLFFTANHENGDFISLELRDGHVVYRFGTEAEPLLSLATENRYNTNMWVRVEARRQGRIGRLDVRGGTIESLAAVSGLPSPEALHLGNSKVYIGGVPDTYDTQQFSITRRSFLGCLQDVKLVSKSSSSQDLSQYTFVGLQSGCGNRPSKIVGLTGEGYVELGSPDLPRDGGLAFSFRSTQDDALLLLAQGYKPDNFYSVALSGGMVSAWFSAGSGVARITSKNKYNDGYLHSVSINKQNRYIAMYIDDVMVGFTRLPPGAARINSMRGSAGGLYLGGLPVSFQQLGAAASYNNLQGCLMDLILNGQLLVLDNPVSFDRADVGRCDEALTLTNFTNGIEAPTMPQRQASTTPAQASPTAAASSPLTTTIGPTVHPDSCAPVGNYSYTPGVSFGDLKGSHSAVLLDDDDVISRFNVSMHFRTFHKEGMIFYLADMQQTNFIAVMLKRGSLNVVFNNADSIRQVTSGVNVSTGQWINLNVHQDRDLVSLQVGNEGALTNYITRTININNTMFVAGFPTDYTPRHGVVSESFKGCIRDFSLDKVPIDLTDTKSFMGVRRCFRDVERGIHFDGHGFATYENHFTVGSNFSVEFDFRTVKMEGVLFSTSDVRDTRALSVELFDGLLHFRMKNSGETVGVSAGECRYCLCDNRWHSVTAQYSDDTMTVQVDRSPVGEAHTSWTSLITYDPLYIGGYPRYETRGSSLSENRTKYQGCLRNVVINKTPRDWHQMSLLTDVHVSACPHYDTQASPSLH